MSYSDLEHFSNMIAGCESLTLGDVKSPDAIYAFTVLKLHAGDAGLVAGTEGFLDHVKKGAKKGKEWFLAFFKALKEFFQKTYKAVMGQVSKLSGKDKEKAATSAKSSLAQFNTAFTILEHVSDYADELDSGYYREMLDFKNDVHHALTLSKSANKHDVDTLIKLVKNSMDKGHKLADKLSTDWERNAEKADQDEYKRKEYMLIGKVGVDIGRALGFVTNASNLWSQNQSDTETKQSD